MRSVITGSRPGRYGEIISQRSEGLGSRKTSLQAMRRDPAMALLTVPSPDARTQNFNSEAQARPDQEHAGASRLPSRDPDDVHPASACAAIPVCAGDRITASAEHI